MVPITFLDKYNSEQFEIIGEFNRYKECDLEKGLICGDMTEYIEPKTHGVAPLLIKRKNILVF